LILLACFVVSVAPELTWLLLGPAYQSASQFVVWGALAEAARVVVGVYGMVAHAKMNTKLLLAPNLIGAVTSSALVWWLMPKLGLVGAGIALTVAGMAVVLSMHGVTRKELEITLPYRPLMKMGGIGVVLLGLAAIGRIVIGEDITPASTLTLFSVLSLVFLPVQYWLLRPLLHDGKS